MCPALRCPRPLCCRYAGPPLARRAVVLGCFGGRFGGGFGAGFGLALPFEDLPRDTRLRIALAVAEHRGDSYSVVQYAKQARAAGMGLDEVSRARSFASSDEHEQALLTYLKAALEAEGDPPIYLHEEAREAGWDDEHILEALAHVALGEFQSVMAAAAALPKDQATPRVLPDAA